jgi:phosphoglycolate phosphatase
MRAQALLFDKDGTLFDFQKTWAGWLAGLIRERAGNDVVVGTGLSNALGFDLVRERFLPESIAIAGTALQMAKPILEYYPGKTAEHLAQDFDKASEVVVPVEVLPLAEFLDELIGFGLPLGIATNDGEASARAQLDVFDVTHRFDFIAGYDSGFGAKPDAGMCTAFADQTGIAPEQIVMVGDSLHDLHAGRAAGMQCVAVLTGVAEADELAPVADIVLPDISHLQDWLHDHP